MRHRRSHIGLAYPHVLGCAWVDIIVRGSSSRAVPHRRSLRRSRLSDAKRPAAVLRRVDASSCLMYRSNISRVVMSCAATACQQVCSLHFVGLVLACYTALPYGTIAQPTRDACGWFAKGWSGLAVCRTHDMLACCGQLRQFPNRASVDVPAESTRATPYLGSFQRVALVIIESAHRFIRAYAY